MVRILEVANAVLANPKVTVERRSTTFWPSEFGLWVEKHGRRVREGGCNRAAYYRFTGTPPDSWGSNLSSELVMSFGNLAEEILAAPLKVAYPQQPCGFMAAQVPVWLERKSPGGVRFIISGKIDLMVGERTEGNLERPIGVECKSASNFQCCSPYGLGLVKPTKKGKFGPRMKDVLQVMPYLTWFKEQGVEAPEFHLIYFCRDDGACAEHVLTLSDKGELTVENDGGVTVHEQITEESVFADLGVLADAIKARAIPDRPFKIQYSNDDLDWMDQNGMLSATDSKNIAAAKARKEEGQWLAKGDFNCRFCDYAQRCWQGIELNSVGAMRTLDTSAERGTVPVTGGDL